MFASASREKFNGNTLKLIACIAMATDHFAAGIILISVNKGGYVLKFLPFETFNLIYETMRNIGRIALPIFCFLLVEGFIHTKSRLRYALSLFIFGLISEPIYDITFHAEKEIYNPNIIVSLKANSDILNNHSNIYFTLLLGLISLWAFEAIVDKGKEINLNLTFSYILAILPTFLCMFIAEKIVCNYRGFGVALIMAFYLLRSFTPYNLVVGYMILCCFSTSEYYSLPAFILLYFYNKKRGRNLGKLKYAFYLFYPVHILLIYMLRCFLYISMPW